MGDNKHSLEDYVDLIDKVAAGKCSHNMTSTMMGYVEPIFRSELQDKYSKPMLWIGMYIALASLLCILAMAADLLHGIRNRKFWIPCKYFKINATSLQLISVAMKLPVDLSGSMPGDVDQGAKLGSMAFMCTMMANLLPSLAAMDNKELLSNIPALGISVITMVVNVCIQINTGVVSFKEAAQLAKQFSIEFDPGKLGVTNKYRNSIIATVYVTILLVLLIIHVCSSLAILKSKQIIETKYQSQRQHHKKALKDVKESSGELLTEKLQEYVRNYWIMAGSGSPQFIAACSVTTTAAGVISVIPAILHTLTMSWTLKPISKKEWGSDYDWSMVVILIVQFIGVIVGTIAPFSRCFATLNFKFNVSIKSISKQINVFKVERYWSSKLSEWKLGSTPFPFRGHKLEAVIHHSRKNIISFCIELQEWVVVICKTIALIPFFIMICFLCCFHCLQKAGEKSEQKKNLRRYVLQLEDENELAEGTLEGLLKSMDRLIEEGKNQNQNLIELLAKSNDGFPGVEKFDNRSLLSEKYHDCWSLPVVTLTAIAASIPDIGKAQVDSLLLSVREGLKYVTLVEETLNATHDYACARKAAETLWPEVNFHHKWLGNDLHKLSASTSGKGDKTRLVIEDMAEKSENLKKGSMDTGGLNDDSTIKSICANSMYRITQTILLKDNITQEKVISPEELFAELSSMIADIMAACLTNLPQVIEKICDTSEIEKRETSVRAAAKILGQTKEIIKRISTVQARQPLPKMNQDDLPFLDKWRAYLAVLRNP